MRRRCSELVLGIHKSFRLAGVAFQVVIEGRGFRSQSPAVQIQVAPGSKERFMWSDKPNQQAERLIAAILVEPRQRAIDGQIVWIDIQILFLGANLALPAFFEKWIRVIV